MNYLELEPPGLTTVKFPKNSIKSNPYIQNNALAAAEPTTLKDCGGMAKGIADFKRPRHNLKEKCNGKGYHSH